MTTQTLFAMWPIHDDLAPDTAGPALGVVKDLVEQATIELPIVARRARAEVTGKPRWSVRPSHSVPGSGNLTRFMLVAVAPAHPVAERPYHRRTA